jgi:hypothetical protein
LINFYIVLIRCRHYHNLQRNAQNQLCVYAPMIYVFLSHLKAIILILLIYIVTFYLALDLVRVSLAINLPAYSLLSLTLVNS